MSSQTIREQGVWGGAYFWNTDSDADQEDIDAFNQTWSVNHYTILHELGHALTMVHPSSNQDPQNSVVLPPEAQNNNYTVMHYYLEAPGNPTTDPATGEWDYRHFQLYDVYALQLRFGANSSTHAGNSTHTASSLGMDEWLRVLWDAGGTDTIDMSAMSRGQRINLGSGQFSDVGSVTGNNPTGDNLAIALGAVIENAYGGSATDSIIGNDAVNLLRGNAGDDNINGSAGNDIIFGDGGLDTLNGGAGNDRIRYSGNINKNGYDSIASSTGLDTVQALADNTQIGLRQFNGIETFSADGHLNVWIVGSGGHNVFNFVGVTLDNVFVDGGAGNDTIAMFAYTGPVRGGDGNDIVYAGSAEGILEGGSGNDQLFGEAGNDVLIGGVGSDDLTGGSGADQFIFTGSAEGDQILDFSSADDTISLEDSSFSHTSTIAFVQGSNPQPTSSNSTFLYNSSTGLLSYDADGSAGGSAVALATLSAGLTLSLSDFTFV